MAPPFQRMPGFEAAVPDIRNLTQPLQQGLDSYRQGMDAQFKGEMLKKQDARADQEFQLKKQSLEAEREAKFAARMAGVSQHILGMPAEQQAVAWGRMVKANPNLPAALQQYGVDPNDHVAGANFIIAQARGYQDPMDAKMKAAELQLKQAQANKFNREASDAGSQFGKQGTIIQDRNGNFYSVQFGANGQRKVEPLDTKRPDQTTVPLQPSRGVGEVDTGTGTQIIDMATGLPLRQVQKDVAGREQQEAIGKAQGEGMANWSKAEAGYRQFENKTKLVADTIDRAISRIGPMTTGVGGAIMRNLPASEARALAGDLDTIRANLGFKELETMRQNSPTGAALGAVSDVENRLLQSTQAALDQMMKGQDLEKNLGIVKTNLSELSRIQADKFAQDRAKFGRQQTQQPVATPQASGGLAPGEYVWDGTQLVPKGR